MNYDPGVEAQKCLIRAMGHATQMMEAAIEVAPKVAAKVARIANRKVNRIVRGERACRLCHQMAYIDPGDFGVCSDCWKREGIACQ